MESRKIEVNEIFEFQMRNGYGSIQSKDDYKSLETAICKQLEMKDDDRLVTNITLTMELDDCQIQQKCCNCFQDKTAENIRQIEIEKVKYDNSELINEEVYICLDCMPKYFKYLAKSNLEWQLEQLQGESVAPEPEDKCGNNGTCIECQEVNGIVCSDAH